MSAEKDFEVGVDGVCVQIKQRAVEVIDRLGATVGLLEEALEEVCGGDCAVCPVNLRRSGVNAAMNAGHSVVFGITSGWQNLIGAIAGSDSQDS